MGQHMCPRCSRLHQEEHYDVPVMVDGLEGEVKTVKRYACSYHCAFHWKYGT